MADVNHIAVSNSAIEARPVAFVRATLHGDPSSGYLTAGDIALVKAATHTEFNWPPGAGEGSPESAFELSMLRHRQMLQGSALAELTRADLVALRRSGVIDDAFFNNALEYLASGGEGTNITERTDVTSGVDHRRSTMRPGTKTPDGSIYL